MGKILNQRFEEIKVIVDKGINAKGTVEILKVLDAPPYIRELVEELELYSELLPLGREHPFTAEQRYLHFLWDTFDKLPICLFVNFAILFRRLIAEHLFKRCGTGFIAEENLRFNFGQNIEIGDSAFFNRNVFIDSKGGVAIGNYVGLAEDVRIFTHTHSEASHIVREYHPVVIKDYAMVYTGAVILPGVTIGEQAIVASHAMVTADVPPNTVVAGMPATVIRERKTEGRTGEDLDHLWLY
ncbi:MAG: acyltransferase [Syntrophorhabdaceae bacterium]|nr:acyltransferase [Syntrophorhabdaceae bacterium]MDD5244134.1 acyltransferase [Syntrophorhabdaceae bacterium]